MFLVDTNVISRLSPETAFPGRLLLQAQFARIESRIYFSTVTVAEIERGIARALRVEATTKARHLRQWLDALVALYGDHILPFDMTAAKAAGPMMDRAGAHDPSFADVAIAATAKAHDLVVLTENLRHFEPLEVECMNPFTDSLP